MTEAVFRGRVAGEAQRLVFSAAEPFKPHENITQRIQRAVKALDPYGVPAWRVEEAWKGRAQSWAAWALEQLREADERRKRDAERRLRAAGELDKARLGALHTRLSADGSGFHDETVRAVGRVLSQRGGGCS